MTRVDGSQPVRSVPGTTGPTIPELGELAERTERSLGVLRWLLMHHEAQDGTPLGVPGEQLARMRGEAERLIEAFEQIRVAKP